MLVSVVYDVLWLFFIQDRAHEAIASEGGLESNIALMSLYVSYFAFIFKVSASRLIINRLLCSLSFGK